ncbi:MAG: M48 family metallopeptidase [Ruminococcaceae bacterium]|nr:M48 family metallopeptidase [Oscillospiraceae bacterium]
MIKADEIIKSKRKTLTVSLDRDGRVIVRAPKYYSDKQINAALADSENWIRKQLAKYEKNKQILNSYRIADGGKMLLLGEDFEIRFADIESETVEGRTITLPESDPEKYLKALYRRIAKNYFTERTNRFAAVTGLTPSSVRVTGAKTRWGSCSAKKSINFSLNLVMCPPEVIDYVIVHELCHIKYMDHSKLFWNEVEKHIPDYKQRRKWLKDNRFIMDLI